MKNKKLIITIVIILAICILAIGIYFLLKKSQPTTWNTQIEREEISIGNSDLKIELSEDLDVEKPIIELLKVSEKIQIEYIEQLISKLNIDAVLTSEVEGVTYRWCNTQESRCLVYDIIPDTLSFSFDKQPLALKYDISGITNPQEAWGIVLNELSLERFSYTDENIQRSSEGFALRANRAIKDIPIRDISTREFSDVINFSNKGFLLSGRILLVDYVGLGNIPILSPTELKSFINDSAYPKQYIVDRDSLEFSIVQDNVDIDLGYPEQIFTLEDCKATDIELVYIFRTRNVSQYIIPAYKLSCSSEVEFEESVYTVAVSVYANAISPEYILVE